MYESHRLLDRYYAQHCSVHNEPPQSQERIYELDTFSVMDDNLPKVTKL